MEGITHVPTASHVRPQWVTCFASSLLAVLISCGSAPGSRHHSACFTPAGSATLCYETISHTPSFAEKMKGSPGIALRAFGRASDRDINLFTVSGGPEYPDYWNEQVGRPDCYPHFVDFDRVIEQIKNETVKDELKYERDFAVMQIQFWRRHTPTLTDVAECERIGVEGMVAARAAEEAEMHGRLNSKNSAGMTLPRFLNQEAKNIYWTPVLSGSFSSSENKIIGYEVVTGNRSMTGTDQAGPLAARFFLHGSSDVTLAAVSDSEFFPNTWELDEDAGGESQDAIDTDAFFRFIETHKSSSAGNEHQKMLMELALSYVGNSTHDNEIGRYQAMEIDGKSSSTENIGSGQYRLLGGSSGSNLNSADIRRAMNRGNKPKRGDGSSFYKAKVSVFAERAFGGIGMHTGTITQVERQLPNGKWIHERTGYTCNHGDCPDHPDMQYRYTCDPGVATPGWYGFDGECEGLWGFGFLTHLCNDDTSLQINNVFGRWSGNKCKHTHRFQTPGCHIHW